MDFPPIYDEFYNWDSYYQDPFTTGTQNNVIYPNAEAYPSPAPSTESATHCITELGTMPVPAFVPQVFAVPSIISPTLMPAPALPVQKLIKRYPCDEPNCDKAFSKPSALKNHKKVKHSDLKRYSCDECEDAFANTHERTMHKIHNHEGRRYSAKRNPKSGAGGSAKTQNPKFPGRRFDCEKCQEFFMHKNDLLKHMRNRHTGTGAFPCLQCSAIFYTYDMFVEHRDLHDESITKYSCTECDKKFLTERKLKDHSAIHKERTFYKCEICGQVFVRSQTLQYHRMTCRAEFKCDRCVDSFMNEEFLTIHQALHKIDKHECKKCNKIFADTWTLQNHEKRHLPKMNYTCSVCGDLIGTQANYQKHLKNHIEANLKCRDCGDEFTNLVKYGYHKAEMHSALRPYDCILCPEEFCTRKELFIHIQNHNEGNIVANAESGKDKEMDKKRE